jgi:hypothetical protein
VTASTTATRPHRYQDPGYLSQMAGQMNQQQPGLLGQILSGALGSGMGGGFGAGMSGGTGGQGMLNNPVAKAALAGIAAIAVKKMMSGR